MVSDGIGNSVIVDHHGAVVAEGAHVGPGSVHAEVDALAGQQAFLADGEEATDDVGCGLVVDPGLGRSPFGECPRLNGGGGLVFFLSDHVPASTGGARHPLSRFR